MGAVLVAEKDDILINQEYGSADPSWQANSLSVSMLMSREESMTSNRPRPRVTGLVLL